MAQLDSVWQVPLDHPAFAGHFPGRPIVPGVVLLDRAMLLARARDKPHEGNWQVGQAKFLSPCGPGDELVFELRPAPRNGYTFSVRRGDRNVASGHLMPAPP